jgi:hypothetical protein
VYSFRNHAAEEWPDLRWAASSVNVRYLELPFPWPFPQTAVGAVPVASCDRTGASSDNQMNPLVRHGDIRCGTTTHFQAMRHHQEADRAMRLRFRCRASHFPRFG